MGAAGEDIAGLVTMIFLAEEDFDAGMIIAEILCSMQNPVWRQPRSRRRHGAVWACSCCTKVLCLRNDQTWWPGYHKRLCIGNASLVARFARLHTSRGRPRPRLHTARGHTAARLLPGRPLLAAARHHT